MNPELISALWEAANTHSQITLGSPLDESYESTEEQPNPPQPEDPEEVLRQVIAYLVESL